MKRALAVQLKIFVLFLSLEYISGCGVVEQTIYLGDAEVTAPFTTPPTHLNINKEAGDVTFSPKFSFVSNSAKITGTTDNRYEYGYGVNNGIFYKSNQENLQWTISKYSFGLDIDLKISDHISLFGGIQTSAEKDIKLGGGNIGIGFHNHLQNPIIRFDIGLNIQNYEYFAISIVETKVTSIFGENEYSSIHADKGRSLNYNPFISLTVNSSNETDFLNYFGTIGVFSQSLLSFEPGETQFQFILWPLLSNTTVDERAGYVSYSFYANPGLSFSFNKNIRLVMSAKFLVELSTSSGELFIIPSAQLDFQL